MFRPSNRWGQHTQTKRNRCRSINNRYGIKRPRSVDNWSGGRVFPFKRFREDIRWRTTVGQCAARIGERRESRTRLRIGRQPDFYLTVRTAEKKRNVRLRRGEHCVFYATRARLR